MKAKVSDQQLDIHPRITTSPAAREGPHRTLTMTL
jgi:hypothetical protein